jgi:hypothetical protein
VGSRLLWAQISRSISNGRSTILVMVVVLLDGTRDDVRVWGPIVGRRDACGGKSRNTSLSPLRHDTCHAAGTGIYIYIYICMSGASGDSHLFGSMLRDLGIR